MKIDDLSLEHLNWLVNSRAANQRAALQLFSLLKEHAKAIKTKDLSKTAQNLVAVCFSLWRAAFLADKTGKKHAVFEDATNFLGKMIIDNAINYPQDRNAREWTFNYYSNNTREGLNTLGVRWEAVEGVLSKKTSAPEGTTFSQHRWNRYHEAFEKAVECLAAELREL